MMSPLFHTLLSSILQVGMLVGLSPLMTVLLKKGHAWFQGRQGPPLLQGYFDLFKWFRKETVVSDQASGLFLAAPVIVFACNCAASLTVPTWFMTHHPLPLGGMITLIYLLGLGRFFMVTAAMEPGSGFCGMASSREMMLASLIEPVMLLSLFVIAQLSGTTNLFEVPQAFSLMGIQLYTPAYALALIALFIAALAELGRVPFDNPETHYELTMIHEGMLLDYSGQPLGLMHWAAWTKQLLIMALLANLMFPWGLAHTVTWFSGLMALVTFFIKLSSIGLLLVLIETTVAKMRLFRVKDVLGASFIIALIALIFAAQQGGSHSV